MAVEIVLIAERNRGTAIIKCAQCGHENKFLWETEGVNEKDVRDIFCHNCTAQLTKVTRIDKLTSVANNRQLSIDQQLTSDSI